MNKCQRNKTLNYAYNGNTITNFEAAAMAQPLLMKAFLGASQFTQTHATRNNKQNYNLFKHNFLIMLI
jgi:hypothetical protein